MIKDIITQPRGSGKTTWAKQFAEDTNGFYLFYRPHVLEKLRSLPKLTKRTVVIDEAFLLDKQTLDAILDYSDCYDIYLIGTPPYSLASLPSERFVAYLYQHHPELMI